MVCDSINICTDWSHKTLYILICNMENLDVLIGAIALKSSTCVMIHWTLLKNWFHNSYRLINFLGIYMFYIFFLSVLALINAADLFLNTIKKIKERLGIFSITQQFLTCNNIVFVVNKMWFSSFYNHVWGFWK